MTSEPLEVRVSAFGNIEVSKLIGSIYVSLGSDSLVLTRAQITGVYHRCSPMTRVSNKGYQQGIRATFNSAPLLLARDSLLSLLLAKARILCTKSSPRQECTLKYLKREHACLLIEFVPSLLAKNLPSLLFYSMLESRNHSKGFKRSSRHYFYRPNHES